MKVKNRARIFKVFKTLIVYNVLSKYIPSKVKNLIKKNILVPAIQSFEEFISVSYGSHNDGMSFLLIGGHNAGLYSIIHSVVGYLIYADLNGYIPVVDYKNHITSYHDKGDLRNIWEDYFVQPTDYKLNDVFSSKNVTHSPLFFSKDYSATFDHIINNDSQTIMKINEFFLNKIRYNNLTSKYIEEVYQPIKKLRLLGVFIRGTDYIGAKGHHIQPSLQKIYQKIEYFLKKYEQIQGIYVSTEENEIHMNLIDKYGELVYSQKRPRIKNYKKGQLTPEIAFDRINDRLQVGREYLADIEILSRLDYFISGVNNGSAAVIERNGLKFIEYHVFYEGINKN